LDLTLTIGGGSGIGLIVAQTLAANGARVYIAGRTKKKLETVAETYSAGLKGDLIPIFCDVSQKESIARLYEDLSSREKCLCILVNNAGVASNKIEVEGASGDEAKSGLFSSDKSSFEDWEAVYRTNVSSVFFLTAFLPMLQKSSELHQGWPSTIINIASVSGMVKTSQGQFPYNTAKAAVIHLSRMLGTEIATRDFKIRVNSASSGLFPSEMTTGGSDEEQESHIPKERSEGKLPLNRPGRDEGMASVTLYCAANQFLNGQNIIVDGGLSPTVGY
jgi:NAD(P)-dependent dehydrogenase (short-subunit alcohol dehydrogenase family)